MQNENLTNQQHKRYLAHSAHIIFSETENFNRNLDLSLTETDGSGQLNISMQHIAISFDLVLKNFHKCSDNNIIQGLEVGRFQRTCF